MCGKHFLHKWSPWKDGLQPMIAWQGFGEPVHYEKSVQVRQCERCNIKQKRNS